MQIAFHIGANCTDADQLRKSVLRNAAALLQQGIVIPGSDKYRALLRETIDGLNGAQPAADTREILLDAIIAQDDATRVILTNDNFIAIPKRIFDRGVFYAQTEPKLCGLQRLFPEDELSLFFAIRNPVTFLQDAARLAEPTSLREYLGLLSPMDVRWSDVVKKIKRAAPRARLNVWCTEDAPLIWEDLIRLQTGIPPDDPVQGGFDMVRRVLTPAGLEQIKALEMPRDRIARHALIGDLIENFAAPDLVEEQITMEEFTPELIGAMSEAYEDDIDVIAAMDGVEMILPFT